MLLVCGSGAVTTSHFSACHASKHFINLHSGGAGVQSLRCFEAQHRAEQRCCCTANNNKRRSSRTANIGFVALWLSQWVASVHVMFQVILDMASCVCRCAVFEMFGGTTSCWAALLLCFLSSANNNQWTQQHPDSMMFIMALRLSQWVTLVLVMPQDSSGVQSWKPFKSQHAEQLCCNTAL